nr:MAG TPA: hypothetical protein [Caudoviricetes sp.]
MASAWQKLILLCIQAQQHGSTKSSSVYVGKPSYIDPALIPPEPEPEGGETEDAGYQQ